MLHDIIKSLQVTKGTNNKLAMLSQNKDNADLQGFLKLVYEPTVSYYMTGLPKEATYGNYEEGEASLQQIAEAVGPLMQRKVTGFAAKEFITAQVRKMNQKTFELLKMVIHRDIKAGIATTAINKTWPDHVTVVPYQRCVLPKDSNIKKWAWGQPGFYAFSEKKEDGMYANVNVKVAGNQGQFGAAMLSVTITSRNGSVFPMGSYFEKLVQEAGELSAHLYPNDTQLQGELLVLLNGVVMDREKGNGVLNSILQTGEHPGPEYSVRMVVWDAIPLSQATSKNKYNVGREDRLNKIEAAMTKTANSAIRLIDYRIVRTKAEANAHIIEVIRNGGEGTILKAKDVIWLDGDNKDQIKGKLEFQVELVITGFKEGDVNGKHANTFGSLEGESSDGLLEVGVSGMPDATRLEIHNNRDYYRGKIMTVTANDIMFSTDGGKTRHSLFLPRLTEIRLDKSTANSFAEIVAAYEAAKAGANF